jgi:hypothetical protein
MRKNTIYSLAFLMVLVSAAELRAYTTTVYGDWMGSTTVVQNGPARDLGYVAHTGEQRAEAKMLDQQPAFGVVGLIYLYGLDGEWDQYPVYPQESCGQAYGKITGVYVPAKYPIGTSTPLELCVIPGGSRIGEAEDYYFKVMRGQTVIANLTPQLTSQTITVTAGETLSYEMYALEDDFSPSSWGPPSYERDFLFSCTEGTAVCTITATAGPNGVVTPNGATTVTYGQSLQLTATPNPGFLVDQWFVDTNPLQAGGTTYLMEQVIAPHTVNVTFKIDEASLMHFNSQSRSVSASNDKGGSSSKSAPGFDVFNDSASVSWNSYSATGQQNSTLTPTQITASGYANEYGPHYAYESYSQNSSSNFQTIFTVNKTSNYLLSGSINAQGDYGGTNRGFYSASVSISKQGGTSIFFDYKEGYPYGPQKTINEYIILTPGTYTLSISATATASGQYSYWGSQQYPGIGGGGNAEYNIKLAEDVSKSHYYYDKNDQITGLQYPSKFAIGYAYDGNRNIERKKLLYEDIDLNGIADILQFIQGFDVNSSTDYFVDTDKDGWTDYQEMIAKSEPNNSQIYPWVSGAPSQAISATNSAVSGVLPVSEFAFDYIPQRYVMASGELNGFAGDDIVFSADGDTGQHTNYIVVMTQTFNGWSYEKISVGDSAVTSLAIGDPNGTGKKAIFAGLRNPVLLGSVMKYEYNGLRSRLCAWSP